MARPIPEAAPVTKATLPFNFSVCDCGLMVAVSKEKERDAGRGALTFAMVERRTARR
jgi:hypothetical protein